MDKLMALLKKFGIDLTGKEDALKAELAALSNDEIAAKDKTIKELNDKLKTIEAAGGKPESGEQSATISALEKKITDLTNTLTEIQNQYKTGVEAEKNRIAAEKVQKVEALKAKGIKEGKFTEAKWNEKFKALVENDPDAFDKNVYPDLAIDPHFKPAIGDKGKGGDQGPQQSSYRGPLSGADAKILESMQKMDAQQ